MFTLNSYSDVVAVAKTFGIDALRYAMDNRTVNPDTTTLICQCLAWAANQTVSVENVNDGNNEYSVDAVFTVEKIGAMHITGLNHITIIRTGFGAWSGNIREAMEQGIINTEQLTKLLKEIGERNAASEAFDF